VHELNCVPSHEDSQWDSPAGLRTSRLDDSDIWTL
jgi:hypothetical protein